MIGLIMPMNYKFGNYCVLNISDIKGALKYIYIFNYVETVKKKSKKKYTNFLTVKSKQT